MNTLIITVWILVTARGPVYIPPVHFANAAACLKVKTAVDRASGASVECVETQVVIAATPKAN